MMSIRLIILWAFFLYALLHVCAGLVCRPLIARMPRVLYSHTQAIKMYCTAVYYLLVMLGASLIGCWRGLLGSQPVAWKQATE